ncbi:MAG: ABC transporter substrate-binding protein [Bifidobacteriaceae bacterium]|jgi:glucose/mannose transport system substrate-binding protein|nr:ABC transporter substrate-binding protein [Bifidobacteriaceae bacterium]
MRRATSTALVAAISLALAGCSPGGGETPSTSPEAAGAAASSSSVGDTVEVFSWWTSGSEVLGLEALHEVFAEKYPEIEFVNGGVTGGGGSTKQLLLTRLEAGQPPDSFQVHAGKEAQDYIDAGQVSDVSDLYDEFGLDGVFPRDLLDMLTQDGHIYTIPSNVHRANVLWASVPALDEAGIDPDTIAYPSVDAFIADLEKIAADGDLIPLAIGGTWTQVHLLETVLIGELGAEGYDGLFSGTTEWSGPEVGAALDKFQTLIGFTNDDRDQYDWEPPTQMVVDGDAVFTIMGDWVPALLESNSLVEGIDYVWAPSPGTEGIYDFLADSFSMTVGAPNPDGAKAWLAVISSADGQAAFNAVKGSIPARTDVDLSQFSDYQRAAARSFASDAIVGSIQHGAAATIAQGKAVNEAVSSFVTSGASDVTGLQADLAAAFA